MNLDGKLYKGYQKEQKEEKNQEKLRKKHHIDEDVTVVEKPMIGKFVVNAVGDIIVWAARIALIVLAALGLISLLYPEIRQVLFSVLMRIWNETMRMVKSS
ncbi:MAG TPA: hypothetical protein DEP00_00090 [Lachnospiraceae bacterium]|nr:hypothetical protein [Lachnospiraceae bacterium]